MFDYESFVEAEWVLLGYGWGKWSENKGSCSKSNSSPGNPITTTTQQRQQPLFPPFSGHSIMLLHSISDLRKNVTGDLPFRYIVRKTSGNTHKMPHKICRFWKSRGNFAVSGTVVTHLAQTVLATTLWATVFFIDEGTGRHWGHVPPKVLQ